MAALVSTTCPNCNASVELNPEHLVSFCGFCGAKLMLDVDTIQKILIEKEKTKQIEITESARNKESELLFTSKKMKVAAIAAGVMVWAVILITLIIVAAIKGGNWLWLIAGWLFFSFIIGSFLLAAFAPNRQKGDGQDKKD